MRIEYHKLPYQDRETAILCAAAKPASFFFVNLITRDNNVVSMKKVIGIIILVIALAVVSGCTQQAQPAAVITPEVTQIPTVPPTEITPETTKVPTAVMTVVVTTVPPAPKPIMTPSTSITRISIRNNAFVPAELMVLPGTGITWVNDDSAVHAVRTTGVHEGMFTSGDIIPGVEWGYTFGASEGKFEYKDPYTNATGVIIIRKGESIVGNPTVQTTKTS